MSHDALQSKGEITKKKIAVLVLGIVSPAATSFAGSTNPVVGGREMYPPKDVADNAVNSADHATLAAAVKAAGLVDTLKGSGSFAVFAPTNEAFAKLPADTVGNLLKSENKDALAKVLTYHVVAGRLSVLDRKKRIKAGSGQTELKTVSGSTLIVAMQAKNIVFKDEKGGVSTATIPNVFQSNGSPVSAKWASLGGSGGGTPRGSALSFAPSNSHSQCANEELTSGLCRRSPHCRQTGS